MAGGSCHRRNDEVSFTHRAVDKSGKNAVERGSQIWVFVKGENDFCAKF